MIGRHDKPFGINSAVEEDSGSLLVDGKARKQAERELPRMADQEVKLEKHNDADE